LSEFEWDEESEIFEREEKGIGCGKVRERERKKVL